MGLLFWGRNWLSQIRLNCNKIHYMTSPGLHGLLNKYDELFQECLGTFKVTRPRMRLIQVLLPASAKPERPCERRLKKAWFNKIGCGFSKFRTCFARDLVPEPPLVKSCIRHWRTSSQLSSKESSLLSWT